MKILENVFCIFPFFAFFGLFHTNSIQAQKDAVPLSAYGVWDRGGGFSDYSDPMSDYVRGIEVIARWSDIQKDGPGNYDFSVFQKVLDTAAKYNKIVKMSIDVGRNGPMWMYNYGVPRVTVVPNKPKNDNWTIYPYYFSDVYTNLYYSLIEKFSLFLRNQPKEIFDQIAFVQVKCGNTGDEDAYKGEPDSAKYKLTQAQFDQFRIKAFSQFKKYFQDVPNNQIVLTFNTLDPVKNPVIYKWVMDSIDRQIGFGIKGGANNRGHHLTGEKSWKEQWEPYLINPKGMKLFSASEMDNSWMKPLFNINTELAFYWAMLNGLNAGLSSVDMLSSAIVYSKTHLEIVDIFKMFNKYAPQIYPATATAAYSIFHEGLNSANTDKFKVQDYGTAIPKNMSRYKKIIEAYKDRGAAMDDTVNVWQNQVIQRETQTAYNDVGWDIEEGNYERFITQIKPDSTSIGLFRVRGKITTTSSKYDRFARSFQHSTGKDTMYFKFDNELFTATNKPKGFSFSVTWLDKNANSKWELQYKNSQGIQSVIQAIGVGDNKWKTVTATIGNDIDVTHSGTFNSDFMLVNTDIIDDIFNGIEVDIDRGDGFTSIETNFESLRLERLYPNPTDSLVFLDQFHDIDKVNVYNMLGALVLEKSRIATNYLDLSSLSTGVYFVKLFDKNKIVINQKIIKE